jgi:hypothetical protein
MLLSLASVIAAGRGAPDAVAPRGRIGAVSLVS